jgi:hypothetical protein
MDRVVPEVKQFFDIFGKSCRIFSDSRVGKSVQSQQKQEVSELYSLVGTESAKVWESALQPTHHQPSNPEGNSNEQDLARDCYYAGILAERPGAGHQHRG